MTTRNKLKVASIRFKRAQRIALAAMAQAKGTTVNLLTKKG